MFFTWLVPLAIVAVVIVIAYKKTIGKWSATKARIQAGEVEEKIHTAKILEETQKKVETLINKKEKK